MLNGNTGDGQGIFEESVIELIKRRRSVRTYSNQPLTATTKDQIRLAMKRISGLSHTGVRFELLDKSELKKDEKLKLGTYGMISGANTFLAAAVQKTENTEQVGYLFELLILYCTSIGLGTCWIAGTFNKSSFFKAVRLSDNELLPVVSPIGYASTLRSPLDFVLKPNPSVKSRKEWDQLFFKNNFDTLMTQAEAGEYVLPLEMVRLAPSAANRQPWRVIAQGKNFNFYLAHDKLYRDSFKFDVQKVDMGIAMCHFESAAKELGLLGRWEVQKIAPVSNRPEVEYIATWIRE